MGITKRNIEAANLTPNEVQLLEDYFDNLLEEYDSKGNLSIDSLIPIIGNPPRIPDSPDTDARLEAWNEQAEYGNKIREIERLIKCELNK